MNYKSNHNKLRLLIMITFTKGNAISSKANHFCSFTINKLIDVILE